MRMTVPTGVGTFLIVWVVISLRSVQPFSFIPLSPSPSLPLSKSNAPSQAIYSLRPSSTSLKSTTRLHAKPMRLKENVDGVVYVNDKCIDCAACSAFAPASFRRSETTSGAQHIVYQQPNLSNAKELLEARQALAACPVAAIRIETLAERRHGATTVEAKQAVESSWTVHDEELVQKMTNRDSSSSPSSSSSLFPRRFLDDMDDVYWLGHHNEKSFGAIPYLLRTTNEQKNETIWIMIDTPRFGKSAQAAIESLTGPSGPHYLFLSHVDDTADHGKWAAHYSNLKRIFNAGDLGRHNWLGDTTLETVELLLQPPAATSTTSSDDDNDDDDDDASSLLPAYSLNGKLLPHNWMETNTDEVVILSTPGHSPGSMTLYRRPSSYSNDDNNDNDSKPGILFTGDTYAYTTTRSGERKMTGFPRYGNDLALQAKTVGKLLDLDWQVIAPGHGHSRDYRSSSSSKSMQQIREEELHQTVQELRMYPSRRRGQY